MNTRFLPWLNIFGLVAVLIINTLAITLPINGMSTGTISDLYPSLFTPAGFTFSIWSVIYSLLITFSVYQFWIKKESYFAELSLWFLLSCLANVSWILAWHYLFTLASVVIMLLLLFSLTRIFLLLQSITIKNTAQWIGVKLPFLFYLSWICVATIANFSCLLLSWKWEGGFLSPEYWTVAMIAIAALLGLFIAFRFKEPFFLLVLMWAFFGIYSKRVNTDYQLIADAARISAVVLAIMFGKLMVDNFKNKSSTVQL
jgi:translocator protein